MALSIGKQACAEAQQEQERDHQRNETDHLLARAGRLTGPVRSQDLVHLEPFVGAVDEAEECEGDEGACEAKFGGTP